MNFIKENKLNLGLFTVLAAISAYMYTTLPPEIATRFDFHGNTSDHSATAWIAPLLPLVFLGLVAFIHIFVKASPKKFSMPQSRRSVKKILFAAGLLIGSIHIGLLSNKGYEFFMQSFVWGTALFLIVAGNVFGKTERNFVVGIRVPWTMDSDSNWRATHRLAGKLMVGTGLLLLGVNFFYVNLFLAVGAIVLTCIVPAIYSYKIYSKGAPASE